MALSTTTNKVIHSGNASATVFPFTFPIPDASYLSVIYTSAAGVETTLSPSLYSATGIGTTTGGSVTYPLSGSPIAASTLLTLVRTVPYTQTTVMANQGGYYPEVVEARFDLAYMAMQQLAEIVSRYTVSSISNPATEQTNYTLIQALQSFQTGIDKLTTAGDSLTHNGSSYVRLARGSAGQFLGVSGTALAWQTPTTYGYTGVRQTVQHGPVTTAGLPDFLPATNAALSITTQNVSSTYPLVASAANGSSTQGAVNTIGISTANLTWSGLTASRAAATPNFLYGTIAGGVITPASTIVAPVYQWGGTPATTAGLITFNISEMKAYLGNGTTAPQTNLVLFGEAATDGTGVISTVAYAYNGRYDSGYTATIPSSATATARNHNIGVTPRLKDFLVCCTTTDGGYAVGDEMGMGSLWMNDGVNPYATPSMVASEKAMSWVYNGTILSGTKSTGASTGGFTLNRWKYRMTADRGW